MPPRDRRSKNDGRRDTVVRDGLALNRARVHWRGGGAFLRRSQRKVHGLGDAITVHQIREVDLDSDAVRVRAVVVDFDSGIVSRNEFSESGGGRGLEGGGNESDWFEAPRV